VLVVAFLLGSGYIQRNGNCIAWSGISVMPQLLPSVKYIAPSNRGRAKSK